MKIKSRRNQNSRNTGMVGKNSQLLHRLLTRLPVLLCQGYGCPLQTSHRESVAA